MPRCKPKYINPYTHEYGFFESIDDKPLPEVPNFFEAVYPSIKEDLALNLTETESSQSDEVSSKSESNDEAYEAYLEEKLLESKQLALEQEQLLLAQKVERCMSGSQNEFLLDHHHKESRAKTRMIQNNKEQHKQSHLFFSKMKKIAESNLQSRIFAKFKSS